MKNLKFKVKFDNEFNDYYFTPFKDKTYYVWLNNIFETNKGLYAITDDYSPLKVKEYNYNYVIIEAKEV